MDPAAAWAAQVILRWMEGHEPPEPDALYVAGGQRLMRLQRVLLEEAADGARSGRAFVNEAAAADAFTMFVLAHPPHPST